MLKFRKSPKWLILAVALALVTLLAACVPQELTTNVAATRNDVAALKGDIAKLAEKIAAFEKQAGEPSQIERETKDQVIRGRADLLDYRMDYTNFKKALTGAPATKATAKAKAKPATPGAIGNLNSQLSKLQAAVAGTPATKATAKAKAKPATPGIVATRQQIQALAKTLDSIDARLSKIESSLAVAPPKPVSTTK